MTSLTDRERDEIACQLTEWCELDTREALSMVYETECLLAENPVMFIYRNVQGEAGEWIVLQISRKLHARNREAA